MVPPPDVQEGKQRPIILLLPRLPGRCCHLSRPPINDAHVLVQMVALKLFSRSQCRECAADPWYPLTVNLQFITGLGLMDWHDGLAVIYFALFALQGCLLMGKTHP
ncbi:MAG: hypothetical protein ABL903_08590 [Methylococcales bacterium]